MVHARARVEVDPVAARRMACASRILALASAGLGLAIVLGWLLTSDALRDPLLGAIKPNSALALTLVGAALLLVTGDVGWRLRTAGLLGGAAAMIGLSSLAQDVLGVDLGIDAVLAAGGPLPVADVSYRMAALTATAVTLVGAGVVVLAARPRLAPWAIALGVISTILALSPATGYVFDVPTFDGATAPPTIAAPTALGLLLASLSLVMARPDAPPTSTLSAAGNSGALARRLVPTALLVPFLAGVMLRMMTFGEAEVEISLFALACAATLAVITWWAMTVGVRAEQQRRRHLDELQRSERRLATTLSSIADAVVTTDEQARVTAMNQAAAALLGTTTAEACGRRFGDVVRFEPGPHGAGDDDLAQTALAAGGPVHAPRFRRLLGGHPVTFTAAPIMSDEGRIDGAVTVLHDAAERIRTQETLITASRLAALGTLSAGVAHEINNPLTASALTVELLQRHLRVAAERGAASAGDLHDMLALVDDVHEGTQRIRAIVRDMTLFARGDESAPASAVNLRAVIDSVLRIVGNEIRSRARLTVDVGSVPPVAGGESQVGQVLFNLITNAVQAIPEGDPHRHEIVIAAEVADESTVALSVRDTGVGMSPHVLAQLFTPFFTTKPFGSGTGLGLAISRGLVEAMGGTIDVQSQEGRGSTFRVRLRRAENEFAVAAKAAPPPAALPRTTSHGAAAPRLRLLVVDDDATPERPLVATLSRAHDATLARSGERAIELLRRGPAFDAVVCDVAMPDMRGDELYRQVSSTWPELASRFVFITGVAFPRAAQQFLDDAPGPVLAKPLDIDALETALRSVAPR